MGILKVKFQFYLNDAFLERSQLLEEYKDFIVKEDHYVMKIDFDQILPSENGAKGFSYLFALENEPSSVLQFRGCEISADLLLIRGIASFRSYYRVSVAIFNSRVCANFFLEVILPS